MASFSCGGSPREQESDLAMIRSRLIELKYSWLYVREAGEGIFVGVRHYAKK